MPSADDRLQHALGLACSYLERRERTVREVREQLERQEVDAAIVAAAIQALLDEGFLNDARYARLFTEDKRELEGWGADRIRRTLLQRRIAPDLADELLSESSSETELDRAVSLLRRRFVAAPRDRRARDRALGLLLCKGYDSELALEALQVLSRRVPGNGTM